jgi:hypothetical protein
LRDEFRFSTDTGLTHCRHRRHSSENAFGWAEYSLARIEEEKKVDAKSSAVLISQKRAEIEKINLRLPSAHRLAGSGRIFGRNFAIILNAGQGGQNQDARTAAIKCPYILN